MLNERQKIALDLKKSGSSLKEIGIALGVTASRAAQIVNHSQRIALRCNQSDDWTYGLPKKTANALISAGYKNKSSVIEALESGDIGTHSNSGKGKVPGISHKSIAEIAKWAGVDSLGNIALRAAIELVKSYGYQVSKP